jgi:hypothetical protein
VENPLRPLVWWFLFPSYVWNRICLLSNDDVTISGIIR